MSTLHLSDMSKHPNREGCEYVHLTRTMRVSTLDLNDMNVYFHRGRYECVL